MCFPENIQDVKYLRFTSWEWIYSLWDFNNDETRRGHSLGCTDMI